MNFKNIVWFIKAVIIIIITTTTTTTMKLAKLIKNSMRLYRNGDGA